MEPLIEARLLAENYIDYAPRTRREVERRLQRAEYDQDVIEAVLNGLEHANLINDTEFSALWVESRARSKKLGRARLSNELRLKGVDKEIVESAVDVLSDEDQLEAALVLAQKKWKEGDERDPAAKRRLAGFLQRRGYNWSIIEQVFRRLSSNME